MRIRISRLHYPVTVLGPGRRAGIWLQGCTIGCPGCISVDTWAADQRRMVPVADVLDWLTSLPLEAVDGVTISGGEPTEQPEALAALLQGIDTWRATLPATRPTPDVLLFTGREPDFLDSAAAAMLTGADAVVAGRYVAAEAGGSGLRGSENQVLVALTELGTRRYPADALPPRTAVQVELDADGIWMIGIPLPGDLARVEASAKAAGLTWSRRSWRR